MYKGGKEILFMPFAPIFMDYMKTIKGNAK